MKKIIFALGFIAIATITQAQMIVPVKWNVELKPLKGGNQYEIVANVNIDKGFKLYGVIWKMVVRLRPRLILKPWRTAKKTW